MVVVDYEHTFPNGAICPVRVTLENGAVKKITWSDGGKVKASDFQEVKEGFERYQKKNPDC